MTLIWASRLAAAGTVLAGPIVLVYARSDLWPSSDPLESVVWSIPLGLYCFASFGYVIAIGATNAKASYIRIAIAAAGCFLVPIGVFVPAYFLLFGIVEACNAFALAAAMAVFVFPAAAFQILVLHGEHNRRSLEFLAHLITTCGPVLIATAFGSRCGDIGTTQVRIFQDWPFLIAVLPFAALAANNAASLSWQKNAMAIVIALAPAYVAQGAFDVRHGLGLQATIWPVRVWQDFLSPAEHQAILHKAAEAARSGAPLKIGNEWYQFRRAGFQIYNLPNARKPDHVDTLEIILRSEDFGLAETERKFFPVHLRAVAPKDIAAKDKETAEIVKKSDVYIAIRERDLYVSATLRQPGIDRQAASEKLRAYVQNARVTEPGKTGSP